MVHCFKSWYLEQTKRMKQKLQDERVKAIIAQNSTPLSISKHEAVFSQIKTEVEQAHAEMLEAINMLSKSMFWISTCSCGLWNCVLCRYFQLLIGLLSSWKKCCLIFIFCHVILCLFRWFRNNILALSLFLTQIFIFLVSIHNWKLLEVASLCCSIDIAFYCEMRKRKLSSMWSCCF